MALDGVTPVGIVAEIRMRRTLHTGAFLVVEGKDDLRFWKIRCHESCRLIEGQGKRNVVRGLMRLDAIEFEGVLGVVDSNEDHLAGKPLPSANIVATDAHDLECLLVRSSALNSVLAEFGNSQKIGRFEEQSGKDVRAALLERGLIFGRLRWADPATGLGPIRRFVNEKEWVVDEAGLIHAAAESSDGIDAETLRRRIDQLPPMDPWHVVRGHDLLELLKIGLRALLGDLPASTGVDSIASVLRQALRPADLRSTGLWRDMRRWENRHAPFVVLGD